MVMAKLQVTVRERESVNRTLKSKVPVCVGVPLIVPPGDKVSPGGKPPPVNDQVNGGKKAPPVATNVVAGYAT